MRFTLESSTSNLVPHCKGTVVFLAFPPGYVRDNYEVVK